MNPVFVPGPAGGEPWYPAAPPRPAGPDRPAPLTASDLDRAWYLDFHYPRGVVPLGTALVDDLVDGAQRAAAGLPLTSGRGLSVRYVGPHVYIGAVPGDEPDPAERARALAEVRRYPAVFRRRWREAAAGLEAELASLRRTDLSGLGRDGIGAYLDRARRTHARAWRLHFSVMYRLLACHELIRSELAEVGVDPHVLTALLQAADNRVRAADRALRGLAERARQGGLVPAFSAGPGPVLPRLAGDPAAASWLAAFTAFVEAHGDRSDSVGDLTAPSWQEDPEQVLALLRPLVLGGAPSPAVPDAAPPRGLGAPAKRLIKDALRANIVWWNEEHNLVIDLRAHLPVRRAALALAAATRAPAPDAVLFLFPAEVDRLVSGTSDWGELAEPAAARRAYHRAWQARRSELPTSVGASAAPGTDPVVTQILCAGLAGGRGSGPSAVLRGLGVSRGTARGPVRVIRSPEQLSTVRPGDVLVCVATSPSWTPVFGLLAACVCDVGGMLTHAAAVSREHGIPCVCDVGTATRVLRDGDEIEVDGAAGTVTVLSRRGDPACTPG